MSYLAGIGTMAATPGYATQPLQAGAGISAPTITSGAGAPAETAPKGSLYLRTDGSSTSTRAYINTDGGTGWTPVTTAT